LGQHHNKARSDLTPGKEVRVAWYSGPTTAVRLVHRLGFIPLVIGQMVSYLLQEGVSVAEVLSKLDE